jgi:magnesium transporter
MRRFLRSGSQKTGQTPGTAVYVGDSRQHAVSVERWTYDAQDVEHDAIAPTDRTQLAPTAGKTLWLNLDGVHDVDAVETIGDAFGIHPLAVEDVANTGQRPKVEEYDDHLFFVLRMLRWNDQTDEIDDEQVSFALGASWVLSFQERKGDVFDPIRDRLQSNRGRVRTMGADYLAYALMDAIVDHYFVILETLGDRIEGLSERMTEDPDKEDLASIRHFKRELLFMRKSVWPLREVVNVLQRDSSSLIQDATMIYFRDVYDHTIQIIDAVETYRDMVSGLMDLYLTSISNRMNEVMKVLTIIATIFIPLSFVAGVYGMNFVNMPELKWSFGYFAALGVMALMAGGMLVYFKRRKWL